MRIERHVLEQFSDLAESMLRPFGKRGSRHYAALRPAIQLLRVPEGTVLSAHVGYLALQRIVSDVPIPSSIACGDSWLQACTAKQACKRKAGFVEVSLHDRHIRFHWRSGGRSRLLRLQTHPPQSLGPVPPLYRVDGDWMRALDLCGRVVDHQETRYSLTIIGLNLHELLHFGQGWPLVAQAAATRYVCQTMRVSNHARGLAV